MALPTWDLFFFLNSSTYFASYSPLFGNLEVSLSQVLFYFVHFPWKIWSLPVPFITLTISVMTYILQFISNLFCGFYLCPLRYFSFLFSLAFFELICPLIPLFSTTLEDTNFIFILLVATLEITYTLNLSKSEINLYPMLYCNMYLF